MNIKISVLVLNIFAAVSLAAAGLSYPVPSNLSVRYLLEDGGHIKTAEYRCNYRGITYKDGLKIFETLEKKGLSERQALSAIYDGLEDDINSLEKFFYIAPKNAEAFFNPFSSVKFSYSEAEYGKTLDMPDVISQFKNGLGRNAIDIKLKTKPINPELTVPLLKEITKLRAGFTTGYAFSKPYRKDNIALAAEYLNGAIIPSASIFSFNETVGKRTGERGFKEAPVIVEGRLVDDIGGGVCQVSTTLYNAALYADLEIIHAKRHSSAVSYVRPSFDAMVSAYNDLKLRNNTGYPLYVYAKADGESLTIRFYGKPHESGFSIKLRSEIKETTPHTDEIIEDDGTYNLLENQVKRLNFGSDGCVSEGYVDYYKNNRPIKSMLIRKDAYKPLNGVVVHRKINELN